MGATDKQKNYLRFLLLKMKTKKEGQANGFEGGTSGFLRNCIENGKIRKGG